MRVSTATAMPEERLQKLIAAAGLGSRRHAETLLRAGRVSVNGRTAQLGERADPERDAICINGQPLRPAQPPLVLLVNKPAGVMCSCHDPEGRPIVLDLLPERRGMASSVQSCVGSLANAAVAGIVVPLVMHSTLALALTSLCMMGIGVVAWVWVKPRLPD